ncbi:uncharacterized protein VTP21DRAFT_11026 [Calcarisporiella thermophila]|uniref:uncharacterized protein n=1 Tax=Calcarisporiella thermophila TaxID=911321 RepID=UPI0037445390
MFDSVRLALLHGLFALHIVNVVYCGNVLTTQFGTNTCDQPLIAYLVGAIIISCCVLLVAFIVLASFRGAILFGILTLFFLLVWSLIGSIWYHASARTGVCARTSPDVFYQAKMTMIIDWLSFAIG